MMEYWSDGVMDSDGSHPATPYSMTLAIPSPGDLIELRRLLCVIRLMMAWA